MINQQLGLDGPVAMKRSLCDMSMFDRAKEDRKHMFDRAKE